LILTSRQGKRPRNDEVKLEVEETNKAKSRKTGLNAEMYWYELPEGKLEQGKNEAPNSNGQVWRQK